MKNEDSGPRFDVELLEKLYDVQPYTVDMLPHTPEEERLAGEYNAAKGTNHSLREIYITLMNLRKRSKLHPKGRKGPLANASSQR